MMRMVDWPEKVLLLLLLMLKLLSMLDLAIVIIIKRPVYVDKRQFLVTGQRQIWSIQKNKDPLSHV